jgi:hypothetical protein
MNILKTYKRKKDHINYIYSAIHALHKDIFNMALSQCLYKDAKKNKLLKIKIKLYKKYNRRIRLLEY